MRVCKHGCDVKMFCFSRANHVSMNLKKVFKFKTRQVYPFLRRLKLALENRYKESVSIFFSLKLTF